MSGSIRADIAPAELADLLRERGFRAELQEPGPVVVSAASGLGFRAEFANPAAAGRFLDFTLVCAIEVPAETSAPLASRWNASRRFGRLQQRDGVLVLDMDVLLAGGVTDAYLQARVEIWDQLLRLLVTDLRAVPG